MPLIVWNKIKKRVIIYQKAFLFSTYLEKNSTRGKKNSTKFEKIARKQGFVLFFFTFYPISKDYLL
jgi:chlorite dismutase